MKSLCSCHVYPGLLDGERSVAQSWRFLDPLKWIFGPRILPGSNSLWRLHNENALICFPLAISSWLTGSCLLLSAIPGSLSVRSIWLWLFSFLSTSLFSLLLSLSLFLRQTFFYSACSWPLFVQSFLPHPHLLLFLPSACSSPVPSSSLCTAVECIWVLVGSPARTASQIPGLAALHPGCRTHATRHHRQKGGGNEVQYFREPPGCAIFLS